MFRLPLVLFAALACASTSIAASTAPALTYSTYLRDSFTPKAIATDSSGNIYVTGYAIVDPAAAQTTALVIKLNPQASQYLYVRYLGGSVDDYANAIAVDGAGNAYIAGATLSPDFPVTNGGNLGTAPTNQQDMRSFVAKLDPNGNVVFSDLLGGSTASAAQAVAVNAAGQVLVSGNSVQTGFPATAGAYSVPNTANHPYLLELDPTGTKTVFSATGIGGSAIALDSSGDIYVAGTTYLLDYPTTPGAYQATFPVFDSCLFLCMFASQGANQYVTKVNAAGSKLIYSTSVSGSYNTINTGLAVDAAGNAYLTGFAGGAYPYTVTPPAIPSEPGAIATAFLALPFLSKLDPLGQTLLFSVPVGGAGVQVDSKGSVYTGGDVGSGVLPDYAVAPNIPALANVPSQCLPNNFSIQTSAYVSQVDANSGDLLGAQFIGGSNLTATAVALSGSTLWMAGATTLADFPFTPNTLTVEFLTSIPLTGPYPGSGPVPGAYLGAVDFSQPAPPAGAPQIACIVNAANLAAIAAATRYQLLTIFGSGLGPATGVGASGLTQTLDGVSVTFGAFPAPILYASSTQINLAVPLVTYPQSSAVVQALVNGVGTPARQLALTYQNPTLFLNMPLTMAGANGPVALALNADGSTNSPTNPALLGSVISVFVNGLAEDPDVNYAPLQLTAPAGWQVTKIEQATPYVIQVDVQLPSTVSEIPVASGELTLNFGSQSFGGTVFFTAGH